MDIFVKVEMNVFEGIDPALIDRIYSSKEGLDINEFDFKDIIRPNECFVLKSDRSSVLARYNPLPIRFAGSTRQRTMALNRVMPSRALLLSAERPEYQAGCPDR
mgnify:CR=1 FL=1